MNISCIENAMIHVHQGQSIIPHNGLLFVRSGHRRPVEIQRFLMALITLSHLDNYNNLPYDHSNATF
jgi:hypothetical protein